MVHCVVAILQTRNANASKQRIEPNYEIYRKFNLRNKENPVVIRSRHSSYIFDLF